MTHEPKVKAMLKILGDIKESLQTAYRMIRPGPPQVSDLELGQPEPEPEEIQIVSQPFGDPFVTLTESDPDTDTSYRLLLTCNKTNQEIQFQCSWEDWSELHEGSPISLVTHVINETSSFDGNNLEVEVVEQWVSQFGVEYEATMLWVLILKHDNYDRLMRYGFTLGSIEKDKIVCKFKDLPDQRALLN